MKALIYWAPECQTELQGVDRVDATESDYIIFAQGLGSHGTSWIRKSAVLGILVLADEAKIENVVTAPKQR